MIAGNDADAIGRSQGSEPSQRVDVLLRQADVGEIARDHDVVGCLRLHVGHQAVEHARADSAAGGGAASSSSRSAASGSNSAA